MDVLSLRALLTLDKEEYDRGLNDADSQAGSFSTSAGGKFGKLAKAGAVAMGAMAAAAGAATIKIGKDALTAYADYEQLEGGVKKLYGNMGMSVQEYADQVGKSVKDISAEWKRNEEAQSIMFANAKQAFKTAGMSSNQYMEQATSFSAALINSLGGDTVAAAKQTDVAMRAISDNYNTFGGDMENIQYAFQGFAKQNYTMLDNLKLGYGGTKTEMERLIADANTWAEENGKAADLSIDSFSDVVTAIDYIQQKQGVAGTTAREASSTIAGSLGMVKAAYENLMSGLANPDADIGALVSDLTSSISTAAQNILPAVGQLAMGLGQALTELAPVIVGGIPTAIQTAIPLITESIIPMMGVMVETIKTALPKLASIGMDLMKSLISGVQKNAPTFISTALKSIMDFSGKFREGAGKFIELGLELIKSLANGIIQNIPTFIQTVPTIITNFAGIINDNAPKIIATGFSILKSLVVGIIKAIPVLVANIPKIIKAMIAVFTAFGWGKIGSIAIKGIAKGLRAAGGALKSAVIKPVNAVKAFIASGFLAAKNKAVQVFQSMKDGIKKKIDSIRDTIKSWIRKIKGMFPFNVGKIFGGKLKLPSIKVSKKGDGSASTSSSTSTKSFAKAMSTPYVFKRPTNFMAGEAGDEVLFGRKALMNDISNAVNSNNNGKTVIMNITNNISGADDPESYMKRFVHELELQMRMA